jgi:histidine triad (HIT) family protein
MGECIFCLIAAKKIPAKVAYEDDLIFAFEDINPKAPTHTLIIPKEHFPSLNDVPAERGDLLGHILNQARRIAADKGLASTGYRLVLNTGRDAGQEVFHLHVHLFGGRKLTWPPG